MGRDKAMLPFGPELMLQRVVRILCDIVDRDAIVVVAARDQPLPELPNDVIITYDSQPHRGPLEGLAAGLRAMPAHITAAFVTSCDAPIIVERFVATLFEQLGDHEIAVPYDGQFHHPLTAVYRPSVLPIVQKLLAADQRRLRDLFAHVRTLEVSTDELQRVDATLSTLMNLNSPEDYRRALERVENV
jgi:molybdopterin-guanine dinucleotide biosynthesis protein A